MTSAYFKEPLNQSKAAAAILVACLVKTLNETDPSFQNRFLENLDDAYHDVRDGIGEKDLLETLTWAGSIIATGDYNGSPPEK